MIASPFRAYANIFRPFIYLFNGIANAGVRLLGVEPKDELSAVHTTDEISLMISEAASWRNDRQARAPVA